MEEHVGLETFFTKEEILEMKTKKFGADYSQSAFWEKLMRLPNLQRNQIIALRKIHFTHQDFNKRNICYKCWTKKAKCLCEKLALINVRHNIFLYMHYREYGRQTNTGKILNISTNKTQMFLSDIPDEQDQMIAKLMAERERSFVLFPSPDSISVKDFLKRFQKESPEGKEKEKEKEKENQKESEVGEKGKQRVVGELVEDLAKLGMDDFPPLNIVIIDGTWNQAKHLVYNIPPEITRVHVDPTSPSLFLLRKQSQSDRICTIEASALLLNELDNDGTTFDTLISNLKMCVNSVLKDRGRKPVYEQGVQQEERDQSDDEIEEKE